MSLENRLAELRKQAGLSQQELADRLYVSRQAVSRWESGESMPTVENLLYLSELYGVTVDYLLKGDAAQPGKEAPPAAPPPEPARAQPPEAPAETPARRARRWEWIALAACAVAILVLLALYIFRPARSTNKVIPLEDLEGEVVDIKPGNTFSFD